LRLVALGLLASALACASGPPTPPTTSLAGLGPGTAGRYRVWLPPGYPSKAPYPVLYFLHDYFGGDDVLWRKGVIAGLEAGLRDGAPGDFVLVAPHGDRGYWSDSHDGRRRYETWVAEALIPEIERRYRVRTDRAGRAVTGISMGGLGAIKMALRRPAIFGRASSLSGALIPLDRDSVAGYSWLQRRILRRIFGPLDGENVYAENDVRRLAATPAPADPPRLLLRCGLADEYRLAEAAEKLAAELAASGWPVELKLEPGDHDWGYWRRAAAELLLWHASAFEEVSS